MRIRQKSDCFVGWSPSSIRCGRRVDENGQLAVATTRSIVLTCKFCMAAPNCSSAAESRSYLFVFDSRLHTVKVVVPILLCPPCEQQVSGSPKRRLVALAAGRKLPDQRLFEAFCQERKGELLLQLWRGGL